MRQLMISCYSLVLCVICTYVFTINAGALVVGIAKHSLPEKFLYASDVVPLTSNDLYWQHIEESKAALASKPRPPDAELNSRREARKQSALMNVRVGALEEAIEAGVYAMVFAVCGWIHASLFRRVSVD